MLFKPDKSDFILSMIKEVESYEAIIKESDKGAVGLKKNYKDLDQGGGEAAGVPIFLQIHRPVCVALRCGDVGDYTLHGTSHGGGSNTRWRIN